jgi:hypothetical protein
MRPPVLFDRYVWVHGSDITTKSGRPGCEIFIFYMVKRELGRWRGRCGRACEGYGERLPLAGDEPWGWTYPLQFGDYEEEEYCHVSRRKVIPTRKSSSDPGCGTQILPRTLEKSSMDPIVYLKYHHLRCTYTACVISSRHLEYHKPRST